MDSGGPRGQAKDEEAEIGLLGRDPAFPEHPQVLIPPESSVLPRREGDWAPHFTEEEAEASQCPAGGSSRAL